MNLIIYIERCFYTLTHLWAIEKIHDMYGGGIRIWFALADGEYGIPMNWITFVGIVILACAGTATLIEFAVNAIMTLVALGVEKYKARKCEKETTLE